MIGKTLDYYKIEAKIGQGGMGQVFKAMDTRLLRSVAIKLLSLDLDVDEKSRLRFLREAQAASLLNHPNICTVYDIKLAEDISYIVMEYIEGQTLRKLLESEKSLSEKQVIDIGQQICDGLHAAHSKGILHRDIKPDNIMITTQGLVKITDFGLAKLKSSEYDTATADLASAPNSHLLKTSFSTIQGTASYMSPEQIRKEDVDERTDIFSLGIVLYELLTGQLPFHGDDQITIMQAILKDEPEPFKNHDVIVSPDMQRIVLRALEKDKAKRPRDALSLKDELARIPSKSSEPTLGTTSTKLKKSLNLD